MRLKQMKGYQVAGWVLVLGLMVLLQPISDSVNMDRLVLGLRSPTPVTKLIEFDPTAITGVIAGAILGGFRDIAASMLWFKTQEYWDSGQGASLKSLNLMRTVTLLDPHWLEPWRITGWHLCYNLYVETEDPAQRAEFLRLGINALKEGISWNPDRYDLYMELGWTFFDKVKDFPEAAKWLGAAIQFEHPEYIERLIAHGWERLPDMPKALDWYDYCIKRDPSDGTAHGATLTIRERYMWAWRFMEEKKYDAAIDEINEALAMAPNSSLALHMKGHIYEAAGKYEQALDVWDLAAKNAALDFHARTKVAQISRILGREVPEYASDIYIEREKAKERKAAGATGPAVPRKQDF